MAKNIYLTGITGIATFLLFFLGGNYFKFIYNLLPLDYDWIFWTGILVSLVFGLLTIRNWFNSQSKKQLWILLLFLGNVLTSGIIILTGIFILILADFGFPPQN